MLRSAAFILTHAPGIGKHGDYLLISASVRSMLTPYEYDILASASDIYQTVVIDQPYRIVRLLHVAGVRGSERKEVQHKEPTILPVGSEPDASTYGWVVQLSIRSGWVETNEHDHGLTAIPDTPEGVSIGTALGNVGPFRGARLWHHLFV